MAGTNHFGTSAKFGIEESTQEEFQQFMPVFAANGNYLCSAVWDKGDTYGQRGHYCGGGAVDIVTDLGTLITTFGAVVSAKVPTRLTVSFSAGAPAAYDIEGHQHDDNPHTTGLASGSCAGIIPASSGVGVPALITVAGTVSPVDAEVVFEIEHVDKPGATGTHFHGQNVGRIKVSLSVSYEGTVSGVTAGSWLNIMTFKTESNESTPTSRVTAEQYLAAAVA